MGILQQPLAMHHIEDNSPHPVNNMTKTDVDNNKNAICKALLSVLNNCHLE